LINIELEGFSVRVKVFLAYKSLEADISGVNEGFNFLLGLVCAVWVEDDSNWQANILLKLNLTLADKFKAIKESGLASLIG